MTKKEFKKLESICHDEWSKIANRNLLLKTKKLKRFWGSCPACGLAKEASLHLLTPVHTCAICPITKWRNYVVKTSIQDLYCTRYASPYYNWLCIKPSDKAVLFAKEISEAKWSWLKIYEKVNYKSLFIS